MEELRRELVHRPLVLMAVALCVGLTAVDHPLNLLFLLPLLWTKRILPISLALAAGLILAPRPVPILKTPGWADGVATVLSVPQTQPESVSADIEVNGHRYRADFPRETVMIRGELWQVRGKTRPLSESSEFLRYKGIEGKFQPLVFTNLADGPWPFRLADRWRRSYIEFAYAGLRVDDARWLTGFAFRNGDFGEEEREALNRTGTVHLIAASGLHVGAIALIGMAIARWLGLSRGVALAGVAMVVTMYAIATGLHMPTVRAAIAFAVGSAAYLFGRTPDGLSALALAVVAYLPFDPVQVYGIGFQLSTTVVGMLILWPRRRDEEPARTAYEWFVEKGREFGMLSVVAALAAEPILAQREGLIGLTTIPANTLVVPPVLIAVLGALLLHPLSFAGSVALLPVFGGLISFSRGAIEMFHRLPLAEVKVPPFSPYLLLIYYGLWIWFWRPRARPVR